MSVQTQPDAATAVAPPVALASLPAVNLLPPEIGEARRFRRAQAGMLAAVVAVAGGVVLLHSSAAHSAAQADAARDAAAAGVAREQSRVTALGWVTALNAQVVAAEATLTTARAQEVHFSGYLDALTRSLPPQVFVTSMSYTEGGATSGGSGLTAATTDPTAIGTVSLGGEAFTNDDVAALADSLARTHALRGVVIGTMAKDVIGSFPLVKFSITATLTNAALVHPTAAGRG